MKNLRPGDLLPVLLLALLCCASAKAQRHYQFVILDSAGQKTLAGVAVESEGTVFKKSNNAGEIELDLEPDVKTLRFSLNEYEHELSLDSIPLNVPYKLRH